MTGELWSLGGGRLVDGGWLAGVVVEDPLKLLNTRTPSKKTNTQRHKNTHATESLMVLETPAQHVPAPWERSG